MLTFYRRIRAAGFNSKSMHILAVDPDEEYYTNRGVKISNDSNKLQSPNNVCQAQGQSAEMTRAGGRSNATKQRYKQ